jgi:Tfp pilus assembly protein PilN
VKPVNLIPPEERRGSSASSRTGSAVYFIVGGLAVVLVAVCAVVFLGNQVSDKEAEAAQLEAQATETEARADSLSSYVSFQQTRDARVATIDSLAKSRFDWERVIHELSVVIPKGVWLQNLTGTVAPEVQLDDSAAISQRTAIPGPALELVGCSRSQPDIARLIASMHDIDGVTRVTAVSGVKSQATTDSSDSAASSDTSAPNTEVGCPRSAPAFQLVAAFDAVAVPDAAGTPAPTTPAPTEDSAGTTTGESTTSETTSTETTTSEQQNVSEAGSKVKKATNLVPGG